MNWTNQEGQKNNNCQIFDDCKDDLNNGWDEKGRKLGLENSRGG